MKNMIRWCALLALGLLMQTADAAGVSISSTPVVGGWTDNFTAAKAMADAQGIPLVLLASSTGCTYCNAFNNDVFTKAEFQNWCAGKPYLFCKVQAIMGNWTAGQPKAILDFVGAGGLPRFSVYWNRANYDGGGTVGAKNLTYAARANMATIAYTENFIEKNVGAYSPTPVVTYKGGTFVSGETAATCLQAEPSTTTLSVPLTRESTEATSQTMLIDTSSAKPVEQTVTWAANETTKTVEISNFNTTYYAAGKTITLTLLDDEGETKSTAKVMCVNAQANSPANPYWIGERTADALAWGEWTMDLDVAKAKVKAYNAANANDKAYMVVLMGGSLWCPDCEKTDAYLFNQAAFKTWAQNRKVVFGVVDLPPSPQDATSTPSLLDYRSGTSYFGDSPKSGAGYLSRKMADAAKIAEIAARNKKLAGNDSRGGGYNTPDRIESGEAKKAGRPGVPILVSLRDDGTVAGRLIKFASKSPTAYNANYLTRLDELLAQVDDADEEANDDRRTTKQSLAKSGFVDGALSHTDAADVYKVPNGGKISFIAIGDDAADVTLEVIQVGAKADTVVASATGNLTNNVAVSYAVPASGSYYLKISGAGAWFAVDKSGSTRAEYTLVTTTILTPTESAQTEPVTDDTAFLVFEIQKDVTYRITGVDPTFSKDDYLVHSSGDLYVGYADAAVPVIFADGAKSTTYQIWNTGRIGFAGETALAAENAGTYKLKIARTGGTAGTGAVKIEVDKAASTSLSGIYEFASDGAEHTWADGTAADWEVPVTILDNDYADGDQKIVFKLTKLTTSDVGVSIGTFTLTVKDNDKTSPGKLALALADAASGATTVAAKEGTQVSLTLKRTGGSDGTVGCTLTANGGSLDKTSFSWDSRDTSEQSAVFTVPAYERKNQKCTVTLVPGKGVTAVSNARVVTIQVVSANAPSFETAAATYDCVRYVDMGAANKIAVVTKGTGTVKVTKASGAIPAGVKFAYADGALTFTGVPTAADTKTATFRVSQGNIDGETVAVTFSVEDPARSSTGGDALNPSVAKARTFSDIIVLNASEQIMIGKLTVTIPPTGRVSARYQSESGTVSLSAKSWSKVDSSGTLTAEAVGTPAKNAGYTLTVTALADGGVTYSFYDPAWPEDDEIHLVGGTAAWSRTNPATRWQGYYTVSLPQTDEKLKADAFAKGDGYLTLKMNTSSTVNAGKMTYAGILPSGKAISGTATLAPEDGEALLPVFLSSSTDVATGVLSIRPDAAANHTTNRRSVYPYSFGLYGEIAMRWINKEGAVAGKAYESRLGVYGGYYSPNEALDLCCEETFETTDLTFFAIPAGLVIPANGSAKAVWSTADTGVSVGVGNTIKLATAANAQRLTFSFNKTTGIVSGAFNLGYEGGGTVRATYKAVVMPGWGSASCVVCNPGSDETKERPFISGAAWFTEKFSGYGANGRLRTVNVKRGCPVSVGLEAGQ